MVLSIADILTAQQVERPYKPAQSNAPAQNSDAPRFNDYLDVPDAPKAINYITDKTDAPRAENSAPDAVISRGQLVVNDQNNSGDSDNNANNPTDIIDAVKDKVTEVIDKITGTTGDTVDIKSTAGNAQKAVTIADILNAIKAQEANSGNLTDEQTQAVNDILPQLAESGIPQGITAEQAAAQLIAQVKADGGTENISVDDILQKMNLANFGKKDAKTVEELAAQALLDAKQAGYVVSGKNAATVIAAAKDEANKPEISATDLKSLQLQSLAGLNKNKDQNSDGQAVSLILGSAIDFAAPVAQQQNIATSNIAASQADDIRQNSALQLQAALAQSNDTIASQNLDNSIAHETASSIAQISSIAGTLQNNAQGTTQNNFAFSNVVTQAIGQADSAKNDFITTAKDIPGAGATMSTENFIKFQNMLDNAQATAGATTNSNMKSPAEIMAQIKFGLSGMGKNENNISIQLHPKELGKVDINMQISHDGKTHIMVIAEKTDTLNLLQKEADSLKGMLTDALNTDSSNLNFSFQQGGDEWRQQFTNNSYMGGNNTGLADNAIPSNYLTSQSYAYNMIATDGLDIRV